ncbi:hypothetical protein TELCIR_20448 [Teladorsagia circumcincta]|uniref:Uncharacterized protein n=1 Tax=Teladorsagia circumcincta TaxID=45464 RepID=A0A2G9TKV8_TELCI|nr:hypothetical protein TELCIR_20448 [Teladorsagia circumcincta]
MKSFHWTRLTMFSRHRKGRDLTIKPPSTGTLKGELHRTDTLVLLRGGSCAIDPLGKVLVEPDFTKELIHYVNIDLSQIARGKMDLDTSTQIKCMQDSRLALRLHCHHSYTLIIVFIYSDL